MIRNVVTLICLTAEFMMRSRRVCSHLSHDLISFGKPLARALTRKSSPFDLYSLLCMYVRVYRCVYTYMYVSKCQIVDCNCMWLRARARASLRTRLSSYVCDYMCVFSVCQRRVRVARAHIHVCAVEEQGGKKDKENV